MCEIYQISTEKYQNEQSKSRKKFIFGVVTGHLYNRHMIKKHVTFVISNNWPMAEFRWKFYV